MAKVYFVLVINFLLLTQLLLLPGWTQAEPTKTNGVTIESLEKIEKQVATKVETIVYQENNWLHDFEVHFFISLPFTALYSYLAVSSLDAIVQGQYPTSFRTTNSWIIAGLAVGASLAISLGSTGRVSDQSVPTVTSKLDWHEAGVVLASQVTAEKMEFIKILY